MNKQKYICIGLAIGAFVLFTIIEQFKTRVYNVLEVKSPLSIVVDLNNNGVQDENECLNVLDGYEYIKRENIPLKKYNYLKQSDETLYALSYLVQNFSKDILQDKRVSIKRGNCIYVGNDCYNNLILKSGYVFKDGKPVDENTFKKRLEQIKRSEYKLYNSKSNKYHSLSCKYGLLAHNYVILSKYQIPKDAKRCKYCLGEKKNGHTKRSLNPDDIKLPDVKCPPLMLSKGCVKVFLTDFTVKRKPDKQGNTLLCQELVRQINSAQSTIDIAIYGYDRVPVVEKALRNALKRGVKIRLVYDVDTKGENIYANTKELVGIIKNAVCDKAPKNYQNKAYYTNSLMHNKFYVFDRQTVITGSANLSATDMSGYNSNSVILIKSKKVAQVYETEFEQMYSSKFHALKHPVLNKENVVLGDMVVSIYFSPTDSAIEKVIVPLVNNAKKYIYMPVFLITDKRLAQALINAKSRGVDVKLIVDATNSKAAYSKHRLLRQHGIPVKTENYGGKLHSKSIMIDDKYTVIGSMNFSKSGEAKNDENLIVIKDEKITKFYKTFFCYLWNRIFNYWLTHDVSAESIYSIGSCSDGIDNDYDGLIDSADEGCKIKPKIKFK